MTRRKRTDCDTRFAKAALVIGLVVLPIITGAATVTSGYLFNGRWRMNTASITADIKPTVFQVRDGRFRRDDDTSVTADGHFHPVDGDGYIDEQSITIERDHLVREVDKSVANSLIPSTIASLPTAIP